MEARVQQQTNSFPFNNKKKKNTDLKIIKIIKQKSDKLYLENAKLSLELS